METITKSTLSTSDTPEHALWVHTLELEGIEINLQNQPDLVFQEESSNQTAKTTTRHTKAANNWYCTL